MKKFFAFLIIFLLVTAMTSCSRGGNPAVPGDDQSNTAVSRLGLSAGMSPSGMETAISEGSMLSDFDPDSISGGHELMGAYRVRLYNDGAYEIMQRRTAQKHFNITSILLDCPTCIKIELANMPGPKLFDFNITLTNPTALKGYDVTGIIRASGDIKFLNPDSYTFLFSYPGDTTPNPYAMWFTGENNLGWSGFKAYTEQLSFEKGGITKFGEMDYLFQASYPGNQEEPYQIWGLLASGDLKSNGSNSVELQCRVGDWQSNIDSVIIDLTPIGGSANTPMAYFQENIWRIQSVSYSPTGQGAGQHRLKVTASSNNVSTYNYLPVNVIASGPIKDGLFLVQYQNLPLAEPNGPTDGMDIAVMGANNGAQVAMVFGGDDTYHFWSTDYKKGTFGLYYQDSGKPIKPFDLPNGRFDFADTTIPDTSVDSIFSLAWGETNTSSEILDATSIPQVIGRQRIALWNMNDGNLKLTANVLVIGSNPGPPKTFTVIVKPIEFASGFRKDGLLYMALAYAAGDESKFPVVDIMALKPPLDFAGNPDLISGGYEVGLDEGSGPGVVNRDALVGMDVDDSGILPITGGYAGKAWIAVAEAGAENVLEIVYADINTQELTWKTVSLPAPPKDCEILPVSTVGQPSNLICVLCADNLIHIYDYQGNYAGKVGGTPYMIGSALRLDIDDTNLALHVLHQGATPLVTVYKWDG